MQEQIRVRVGIVGAGGVAARHARVLSQLEGVTVAAVAEPDEQRGRELAEAHDARWVPSHRELLHDHRPDAVYVCIPPFAHGTPERDVLAAGLPLFVEKPLAADLETAEELAALVEEAGVPTATGYHWRCLDTVDRARELLAEHEPRLVQATWLDKVPPPLWWQRRELSGGQTVEQTTHVLDLLRVLVGEVEEVSALAARVERSAYPDSDVDAVSAATLRFANGAIGTVVSSSLPAAKHRAGVELVADGLVLELDDKHLTITTKDGREDLTPQVDPHVAVDADFIAEVRGERGRVCVPYAEALRTHRLACAIGDSARERRAVAP